MANPQTLFDKVWRERVVVDPETHTWLLGKPGAMLHIDVAASTLAMPDGHRVPFPTDAFARYCRLEGIDQLGFLRQHSDAIESFERSRPWMP